jgi:hypothetical protein
LALAVNTTVKVFWGGDKGYPLCPVSCLLRVSSKKKEAQMFYFNSFSLLLWHRSFSSMKEGEEAFTSRGRQESRVPVTHKGLGSDCSGGGHRVSRACILFFFSVRYLHRTFLVKSGTTFELYPVSFKFRSDHRCHLTTVKVGMVSGC